MNTFLTDNKSHQRTTTKERQIDFMWHLYGQGFEQSEIATLYGITVHQVKRVIDLKVKGKQMIQRNRANV